MLHIAGTPEVEHRVVANNERAAYRQKFACDALKGAFKRLPGRIGNNSSSVNIHAAPSGTSRQLTVFIGSEQAHLLTIEFAEAGDNDRTGGHIDTEGKGIGGKDGSQVSSGKEGLYQNF